MNEEKIRAGAHCDALVDVVGGFMDAMAMLRHRCEMQENRADSFAMQNKDLKQRLEVEAGIVKRLMPENAELRKKLKAAKLLEVAK